MKIIEGSASKKISKDLSKILNASLVELERKRFPDGELYVRILDNVSNEDVIIVQTTFPDKNIVELFLLIDAAKEAKANSITVVAPYYGYARQDQKFKDGEPISARAIAKLISLNADFFITVDPHKEYILDFFDCEAKSCSAVSAIAEHLKTKEVDMILAPDKGALDRAKKVSSIIGCDFDYMEKTRIDGETVEIKPKNLNAKNKTVAIVDDIISTGGTMAKSIQQLKKNGAKQVFAVCTHGLFAKNAVEKLKSNGCDEIISTDTIENDFSMVKTASAINNILSS
jgi:ribose-phosphate pyrophosphokinase